MSFYLLRDAETCALQGLVPTSCNFKADLRGRHSQVGSLAGAAHLLNDNAGVLR